MTGTPTKPYVLVVDDEPSIADLVAMTLRNDGFEVRTANDSRTALALLAESAPELIVLDVMMPEHDGFWLQAQLQQQGNHTPVLFLTARDAVGDKVRGLTLGAYDYMTKPFSPIELVARVRSVLRRSSADASVTAGAAHSSTSGNPAAGRMSAPATHRLTYADLELDEETHEVWRAGRPLQLTPTEFKLLRYLLLNPRRVLSKAQILDQVWHYDFDGNAHVVENFISYLRKQVDRDAEQLIHTVRGVGYCLRMSSAERPATTP